MNREESKSKEEIAQWVITNRYSKSEFEKVSDHEMFHNTIDMIGNLTNQQSKWISDEEILKEAETQWENISIPAVLAFKEGAKWMRSLLTKPR